MPPKAKRLDEEEIINSFDLFKVATTEIRVIRNNFRFFALSVTIKKLLYKKIYYPRFILFDMPGISRSPK